MAVTRVELAGRGYDVHVGEGLLAKTAQLAGPLLRKKDVPIVTDMNVSQHWRETVIDSLADAGHVPKFLVLEPGEAAKSWIVLEQLVDWLLDEGVERGDHILALGGGDLPTDIKVYVSCGTAVCSWVVDKQNHRSTTYDEMARPLPERGSQHPDEAQGLPPTPETIALVRQAMALAPGAAGDIDQIRVDFLVADGRLLAGELTVYPDGGYDQIANSRSEAIINDHWDLTRSHFMRSPHRGLARLYAEALRRNV